MRAIRETYAGSEQDTEIEWYCDLGESGILTSWQEYQCLCEYSGVNRVWKIE